MAAFHVFVEGATDSTPAGLQRLADAIGKHYGLPGADLHARLVKGRFRVKGNTDADTAALYKRDLERLGAIVTVEEATVENSGRATPLPFPAVRPATPPAGTPAVRSATPPAGMPAVRSATPPAGMPAVRSATPPAGTPRPATGPTGLAGAGRAGSTSTPPTGLAGAGRAGSTSTPPTGLAAAGRAGSTSTPPTGVAAAGATPPTGLAAAGATPPTGLAAAGATPPTGLAAATTTPATGLAAATPPAGSPVSRPSTPPPVAGYQSGLSAAFSADAPAATLGALEGDNASFSLGSVDGSDEPSDAAPPASFEPPGGGGLPASIGPAPDKPAAAKAKPARPKDEPLDLFAPPDAQGDEFKVDIADDEKEASARKRASTPPPIDTGALAATSQQQQQPRAQTQPSGRKSQPSLQAPNATATPAQGAVVAPSSSKLGPLGDERVRFAAGVVLSILLGFVPAHFIAGMREKSAYAEIDNKVIRAQQQADTPDTYAMLDRTRADLLARKEAERRNAAIIAIVIWGIAGAAIGFVWFRKIPWDSFE